VDRVNGVHVPELAKKIAAHAKTPVLPQTAALTQPPPKEVEHVVAMVMVAMVAPHC
jgi:hypothetical protein